MKNNSSNIPSSSNMETSRISQRRKFRTPNKNDKQNRKERKVTVILGDSMIKDLRGWNLSDDQNHVVVKTFRGARTRHMKWYAKPTIEEKPENVILHCGTNDLNKEAEPHEIANEILNLATSIAREAGSNIMISGIVPRKNYLNRKVTDVNKILQYECNARNIGFLTHNNIRPKYHCNRSGLHLNEDSKVILSENFTSLIYSVNSEF